MRREAQCRGPQLRPPGAGWQIAGQQRLQGKAIGLVTDSQLALSSRGQQLWTVAVGQLSGASYRYDLQMGGEVLSAVKVLSRHNQFLTRQMQKMLSSLKSLIAARLLAVLSIAFFLAFPSPIFATGSPFMAVSCQSYTTPSTCVRPCSWRRISFSQSRCVPTF